MDTWQQRSNDHWQILKDADAQAKAKKKLEGRYITHQAADGQAVYLITKATQTTVTIEHVDIDDGYVVQAWGRQSKITVAQANEFIRHREAIAGLFESNENWWKNQPIGSVVHYNNGHNAWVRGTIVVANGEHQMMPTALVGDWLQHDLWTFRPDGSYMLGTYVKRIKNGETFQPNSSNMYENRFGAIDPRNMEPIDYNPPTLTEDQKRLAVLAKIHQQVLDIVGNIPRGDAKEVGNNVQARLEILKDFMAKQQFGVL